MRVLLLVHGLPVGGTEVMVCHLARELRSRGAEVEIGCLDLIGELGEQLRDDGFDVTLYERRSGFDRGLAGRIAKHVRRRKYDVVHAHQYTCFCYAALATLRRRFPLIFTEHGRFYPDVPSWKRRVFNRILGGRANRITAVSKGVQDSLVRVEGFPRVRIQVLYNGIDVERFARVARRNREALRDELGLPQDRKIVGTIGRLEAIKNHILLLRSIAKIKCDAPDEQPPLLVIVGSGPERDRLTAEILGLGLGDDVQLLGARLDTPELLASFDVFALSSLSEGTPMTLLEAMAASTPILSTGVGGIPEILEHGQDALLVEGVPPDYRSPPAESGDEYLERFATALSRLLSDVDLQNGLCRRALERVRKEFSLAVICDQYEELFNPLIVPTVRQRPARVEG